MAETKRPGCWRVTMAGPARQGPVVFAETDWEAKVKAQVCLGGNALSATWLHGNDLGGHHRRSTAPVAAQVA